MGSHLEELERQRIHLKNLVASKSKHGEDGALRVELMAVKQKIGTVAADTSHEEVDAALRQQTTLELRLQGGEVELQRIEDEIALAYQLKEQARMRADSEQREEQRKRNVVLEQVKVIDDQLSGRKPIKVDMGPAGSYHADNMARARHSLEQARERVMRENGITEADLPQPPVVNPIQLRPDGRGWT